jgi:hypothetical protein
MKPPSISVNKLAVSIVSKAARKRSILKQRKYPDPEFNQGMYHREAADAIQGYIGEGAIDVGGINSVIARLNQQTPTKIGTIRRVNSNIAALERFLEMLDEIDLCGADPSNGHHSPPKLTIFGVIVSVRRRQY